MKRFLFDALLIFMVVFMGRVAITMNEEVDINQRIQSFNYQVESNEIIETPKIHVTLNQTEENWAGQFGEDLSGMCVDFIDGSIKFVSTFFSENLFEP